MKKNIFLLIISSVIFPADYVDAGNFGIGVHSGYGIIKYEEQISAPDANLESESTQDVFLSGVSGEYSFPKPGNFYAGITIDWVLGLEDRETWRDNSNPVQTNDMRVLSQFYDLRFGYKNSLDNFYYRLYIAEGWDGLYFKRSGATKSSVGTEDFSMWRTAAGTVFGHKFGKWAADGRASYSYYPKASVDNSAYPEITFDVNVTCLDMGVGMAREIAQNMGFYAGVNYTLLKLDQSGSGVFLNSKTEIMLGMVSLTYAF